MARLYEYAVIQHDARWDTAQIVVEPTHVTAASEQIVRIIAARAIPNDAFPNDAALERLEIIVRPFEEPYKPFVGPHLYGGGWCSPRQCETTTNCVDKA